MNTFKRFLWMAGLGALLGSILFAWASPHFIVWYFSPPAELSISCSPAVQWAINSYRKVVFTGLLSGVVVATIFFFASLRRHKAPAGAQAVPPKS
jgi:hypothetical protein